MSDCIAGIEVDLWRICFRKVRRRRWRVCWTRKRTWSGSGLWSLCIWRMRPGPRHVARWDRLWGWTRLELWRVLPCLEDRFLPCRVRFATRRSFQGSRVLVPATGRKRRLRRSIFHLRRVRSGQSCSILWIGRLLRRWTGWFRCRSPSSSAASRPGVWLLRQRPLAGRGLGIEPVDWAW